MSRDPDGFKPPRPIKDGGEEDEPKAHRRTPPPPPQTRQRQGYLPDFKAQADDRTLVADVQGRSGGQQQAGNTRDNPAHPPLPPPSGRGGGAAGIPQAGGDHWNIVQQQQGLPDFKDQVNSRRTAAAADEGNKRHMAGSNRRQQPTTTEVPIVAGIPIDDEVLAAAPDNNNNGIIPSSPGDGPRHHQQHDDNDDRINCSVRRVHIYWLIAMGIVLAVIFGGLCGSGNCGGGDRINSGGETFPTSREGGGGIGGFPTTPTPQLLPTAIPTSNPAISPSSTGSDGTTPNPIPTAQLITAAPTATPRNDKVTATPTTAPRTAAPTAAPTTTGPTSEPTTVAPATIARSAAPSFGVFSTDPPTMSVSVPATQPPALQQVLAGSIINYINGITATGQLYQYPNSGASSEEKALTWLIESDTQANPDQDFVLGLRQRFALAALYYESGGPSTWVDSSGWLTDTDECSWFGITCAKEDLGGLVGIQSVVFKIELVQGVVEGNGLSGGIPVDIGLLTSLREIDLSYNQLNAPLPTTIGQLTALTSFHVGQNDISGTLPTTIGQWGQLDTFNVAGNRISGTLPDEIGLWSDLTFFTVFINQMAGTIPESITNWSRITSLIISGNSFTGTVPDGICPIVEANDAFLRATCDETPCGCCSHCF